MTVGASPADSPSPAGDLAAVYSDAPEGSPLRLTELGLFHPMPLTVLVPACEALLSAPGLPGAERPTVLDAGSGDGRLLAALGRIARPELGLRLVGIECDAALHEDACSRVAAMARRPGWPTGRGVALLQGDWSDPAAFESLGLSLGDFDLIVNYPDGNETRLAALLRSEGRPSGRLALIQPDPIRSPPGCRLEWTQTVAPPSFPRWHVGMVGWQS